MSDYLTQWLEVMRCRLRPSTFDSYQLCSQRIQGTLGRVPVKRITPQLIQHLYAQLLERGLSPRTVFQTHAVLHRALKQARHWGLIQSNPTELVAVPRPAYREMRALSAAQLERLFETNRSSPWYPLWVVLGTVGLRIGEALGLKWEDLDLVSGRLQVRRALQRQRGRGLVFVELKSVTSRLYLRARTRLCPLPLPAHRPGSTTTSQRHREQCPSPPGRSSRRPGSAK